MKPKRKQSGFSLTEVLMAVGILSIGMMLVATMFPLGMHLTAVAAERTIAAVVADQAFAKVQLYGVDMSLLTGYNECDDFNNVSTNLINSNEFAYPAMEPGGREQYYWSALCRKVNDNNSDRTVQVIVFVSRKRGAGLTYDGSAYPVPVKIDAPRGDSDDELAINTGDEGLILSGCTIVDNATGQMYRVIERIDRNGTEMVILDRDWDNPPQPDKVWVVAPPDSGGRDPVIAVFQRTIKF